MTKAMQNMTEEKIEQLYAEIPPSLTLTDDEWKVIQDNGRYTLNNRAIANYIVSSLATGKSLRRLSGELKGRFDHPITYVTLHSISADPDIKGIIEKQRNAVENCLDLVPIYSKANRILKIQELYDECDLISDEASRIKAKLAAIKLANDIIEGSKIHITSTEEKKFEFIVQQIDSNNRALPERNGMNIREWLNTIPKEQIKEVASIPKRA